MLLDRAEGTLRLKTLSMGSGGHTLGATSGHRNIFIFFNVCLDVLIMIIMRHWNRKQNIQWLFYYKIKENFRSVCLNRVFIFSIVQSIKRNFDVVGQKHKFNIFHTLNFFIYFVTQTAKNMQIIIVTVQWGKLIKKYSLSLKWIRLFVFVVWMINFAK